MIIVHYEVYVLEGRGWALHARFPREERDAALAEAKDVEKNLNLRVRVLRETYYTDNNDFEEAEVYISGTKVGEKPPAPRPQAVAAPAGNAPRPVGSTHTYSSPAPARRSRTRSPEDMARTRQIMARLLAVTAIGLAASMLSIKATPHVINLIWQMGVPITLTEQSYGQLLFFVFVIIFLVVAVPLALKLLPRQSDQPAKQAAPVASPPPPPEPQLTAEEKARRRALQKSLDKLANQALTEEDDAAAAAELLGDLPPTGANDADAKPEEPAKPDNKPEEKPDPAHQNSPAVQALRPLLDRFINGAVPVARSAAPAMDAYNKFALHLYMAGAVEALCDFKKQPAAKDGMFATAFDILGTKNEMPANFSAKLQEYRQESRYMGAIKAGRDAMGDFLLGNEQGAHIPLREVLTEWNQRRNTPVQTVTVMFTDMVGSTDLTQSRGDAAAQEVVRRHNAIVRSALAQFNGKEIKHTGDGIMASFLSAADALHSAIAIQKQVAHTNDRSPQMGLHLRIGLNAGEAIAENDDLFGTTVQLAARVCAATDTDKILCTHFVKELVKGRDKTTLRFLDQGPHTLKGFKDPVPLYEVDWL